jgi:hypothetical protein
MDIARLNRITIEEGKCGGRPCIRGYRIRVTDVLELLAAGAPSMKSSPTIPSWNERTFSRPSSTQPARPIILS